MKRAERTTVDWPAFSLVRDIVNWRHDGAGVDALPDSSVPHLYSMNLDIHRGPQGFVATEYIPIPHKGSVTDGRVLRQSTGACMPGESLDDVWQPRGIMWSVAAIVPREKECPGRVDWGPGMLVTAQIATEVPETKHEGLLDSLKRRWGRGALFSVASYALCIEHDGSPSFLASAERTSGKQEMTNTIPIPPFVLMESTRRRRLNECKHRLSRVAGTLAFIKSMTGRLDS